MLNIVWVGSPYWSARRDGVPRVAVIHIAEGSLEGCDSWFNSPGNTDGVSANYAVSRFVPGLVHQYVDVANAAHANGITDGAMPPDHGYAKAFMDGLPAGASPNRFSISIECEGFAGDHLDNDVFATLVDLLAELFGPGGPLAGVPVDREHVLRHGEIGGHPYCPGFIEPEMLGLIAAVNARLGGGPSLSPSLQSVTPAEEADVQTHALDVQETNETANVIFKHFSDVLFDELGSTMVEVTAGAPVPVPDGHRAVLVVFPASE